MSYLGKCKFVRATPPQVICAPRSHLIRRATITEAWTFNSAIILAVVIEAIATVLYAFLRP